MERVPYLSYKQGRSAGAEILSFTAGKSAVVLHLKVEYDLDALTWKYYSRANNESEWEVTGSTGLFQETDNARLLSGLQYLGFRTLTHNDGFSFVISNLVVNGEAW